MSLHHAWMRKGENKVLIGRNPAGKDYTLSFENGALSLRFTQAGDQHEFPRLIKEFQEVEGVTVRIKKQSEHTIKLDIEDDPILSNDKYITSPNIRTNTDEVWAALQEFYLNDDYSKSAYTEILKTVRELLGKIDDEYPEIDTEFHGDRIFNHLERARMIPAIVETRTLKQYIEHETQQPKMDIRL